jgi:hypothetical protein
VARSAVEVETQMSGQFAPIAVDLDQVRKAVGSKSRSLLPALQKRFHRWFENVDEQVADSGDEGPTLAEVLKGLIAGKAAAPEWAFQFTVAVELLYRHFGVVLSDRQFSSMRMEWAERVDEAIRRAGVPEDRFGLMRHLYNRGPAIPFVGRVEMCMGYLSLAEVQAAMQAFAQADYSGLELDVRLAVAEVRSWLVNCDTLGWDLAGFYSG